MKKLIPFTLERWQQGNCTPVTEDAREVKYLAYQPTEKNDYPLCGIRDGVRQTWRENGIYDFSSADGNNLMLEVDCEVVYVSLFYSKGDNIYYSGTSIKQGFHSLNPNLIKEIKVEL
jgi:hypothetical protein